MGQIMGKVIFTLLLCLGLLGSAQAQTPQLPNPHLFNKLDKFFTNSKSEAEALPVLCEREGTGGSDSVGGAPLSRGFSLQQISLKPSPLGELARGDERMVEQLILDLYQAQLCEPAQVFLFEQRIRLAKERIETQLTLSLSPRQRDYQYQLLEVLVWAESQISPDYWEL